MDNSLGRPHDVVAELHDLTVRLFHGITPVHEHYEPGGHGIRINFHLTLFWHGSGFGHGGLVNVRFVEFGCVDKVN